MVFQLKKVLWILILFVIWLILYCTSEKYITISNHLVLQRQVLKSHKKVIKNDVENKKNTDKEIKTNLKYILQWTSPKNDSFVFMGKGQKGFIDRKCPYVNCFVTSDKNLLGDYTKFDVIAFAGPEVIHMYDNKLPEKRSLHQKFVFASMESSDYYPTCSNRFDNYFNWTWTYRLDSEVRWGYMIVKDKGNKTVGPNQVMHWINHDDMDPIGEEIKELFKTKTKAAAWFVSNCKSRSKRENFVRHLQKELEKYELNIDIYGKCGPLKCGRDKEKECDQLIAEKYYFYLSFENSFSEDYVTEKLLRALENDAVPIVFGVANYSRFMSDGMYLNAKELGVTSLAAKMHELINNPEQYYEYFRWKNHYSYHRKSDSVETDEYCLFCTTLNDENMVKDKTVYHNFQEWWDPPNRCMPNIINDNR